MQSIFNRVKFTTNELDKCDDFCIRLSEDKFDSSCLLQNWARMKYWDKP